MHPGSAGFSALLLSVLTVMPAPGAPLRKQGRAGSGSVACFAPFSPVPVDPAPEWVAVGDFNRDGRIDFASVSPVANTVSVRFGDGKGGFTAGPTLPVGSVPASIVAGDWNADGKLDLAVANTGLPPPGSDDVSVLLGDGAGAFAPAQSFPAGGSIPSSIISGDFNGDGRLDLAVANRGVSAASILLGDGVGGFAFAGQFSLVFQSVFSIAAGDFNGDGNLDLVGTNDFAGFVTVLLGTGTGSFGAPHQFPAGILPLAVAVGDVNDDGKVDLVVANEAGSTVSVLLGDGLGAFLSPTPFPAGNGTRSVALADFNTDGHLDIAAVNEQSSTVSVLLRDGSGGFGPTTNFPAGTFPRFVAIADFDGDTLPDLAVASTSSDFVAIFLNAAPTVLPETLPLPVVAAQFPPTQFSASGGTAPYAFALSGTPPPGLTFDAATATLSGVPEQVGTSNFLITVTDAAGCSSARSFSMTVTPVPTVVVLTSSPNPSFPGQAVLLTATVQPSGPIRPTGIVEFHDGPLIGTAPLINGVATLTVSNLSVGTHFISAQYGGDANYFPTFSSDVILQVVGAAPEIPTLSDVGRAALVLFLAAAALVVIRLRS